jgi:alpha-tubulin suppressor-like RCC1 family protein
MKRQATSSPTLILLLFLVGCFNDEPPTDNNGSGGGTIGECSAIPSLGQAITGANPSVSAGDYHTVALRSDGTVMTWGDNHNGQLGVGSTAVYSCLVLVGGLTDVIRLSAGYLHTVALKDDGTVWTWGDNQYGQLGDGTKTDRTAPTQVGGLPIIIAVSGGQYHTLALSSDGTVWAWGQNTSGQLGNDTVTDSLTPVLAVDPSNPAAPLTGIIAITAGGSHSLAIKDDGTVWAWGQNSGGQLGDTTYISSDLPVLVAAPSGITALSAGTIHSLAQTASATAMAWGSNANGQLGDGTNLQRTTPVSVIGLTGVVSIDAGYNHSLAVSGGTVWAWGNNFSGQLGLGTTDGVAHMTPAQVPDLTGVLSVAGGGTHSVALKNDGTVWVWGDNQLGQLGIGQADSASHPLPEPISSLRLF